MVYAGVGMVVEERRPLTRHDIKVIEKKIATLEQISPKYLTMQYKASEQFYTISWSVLGPVTLLRNIRISEDEQRMVNHWKEISRMIQIDSYKIFASVL